MFKIERKEDRLQRIQLSSEIDRCNLQVNECVPDVHSRAVANNKQLPLLKVQSQICVQKCLFKFVMQL
jgi:hypothetical protein